MVLHYQQQQQQQQNHRWLLTKTTTMDTKRKNDTVSLIYFILITFLSKFIYCILSYYCIVVYQYFDYSSTTNSYTNQIEVSILSVFANSAVAAAAAASAAAISASTIAASASLSSFIRRCRLSSFFASTCN